MRRWLTVAALIVLPALLLAACGGDESGGSTTAAQDPADLEGKDWILTEMLDAQGNTEIVQVGVSASFDGSTISGTSGCNQYNGSYEASGSEISFGPVAGTNMACEPDVMAVETQYLKLLSEVASFEVSGRSMSMANGEGTPTLQFGEG